MCRGGFSRIKNSSNFFVQPVISYLELRNDVRRVVCQTVRSPAMAGRVRANFQQKIMRVWQAACRSKEFRNSRLGKTISNQTKAGPGRYFTADNDVFFQAFQVVYFAGDGGGGQDARGFLKRGGREETAGGKSHASNA